MPSFEPTSLQQALAASIFVVTLAAFVWDRIRYDIVAMLALLACVGLGLVAPDKAFDGFGNPAVVTVAAVLVLSHALVRSGVVQALGERVEAVAVEPWQRIALLCTVGATLSAFMNNVGALAVVMPIAITMARRSGTSPALMLMPLSFSTMLGGTITLIGTPPNLLASAARARYGEAPFGFFDFTPVGFAITVAGIAFMVVAARFVLPADRAARPSGMELFDVGHYVTELRIPEGSAWIGATVEALETEHADRLLVVKLLRSGLSMRRRLADRALVANDLLIVQAEAELLQELARKGVLEIAAAHGSDGEKAPLGPPGGVETVEVVVPPNSWLQGQTARRLNLRTRWSVNLLALSRKGRPLATRLRDAPIFAGDVLLLEGDPDSLAESVRELGCLPLADRRIAFEPFRLLLPIAVFATAIVAVATGLAGAAVAFAAAAVAVVLLRIVPARELYTAIDWPIIVLLGAMIPVGGVLEATGLADLLAGRVAGLSSVLPSWGLLAVVLIATMAITPMLNNAATVIVMAPIAIGIAQSLGLNPDAFVMAVAIGASCDFLTPFGHQNNTLILAAGGYRFADFWRLGLPLDFVIVATAIPVLLLVFPLGGAG
ncbi:MAG: SLC13 family permease [Alphaproteobacteria bacterium]|nr:SLC13 family permease [Alphaproteobacteria bacterium]